MGDLNRGQFASHVERVASDGQVHCLGGSVGDIMATAGSPLWPLRISVWVFGKASSGRGGWRLVKNEGIATERMW